METQVVDQVCDHTTGRNNNLESARTAKSLKSLFDPKPPTAQDGPQYVAGQHIGTRRFDMAGTDAFGCRPTAIPQPRLYHALPSGHEDFSDDRTESRRRNDERCICAVEEVQDEGRPCHAVGT